MLFIASNVETYFQATEYPRFKGEEIKIRMCDVGNNFAKSKIDVLTP